MSDLTAFHDAITDQDINAIGDTDLAMAAIDKAFDAGQADTVEQGVATPSDNNQLVPPAPPEVGEQPGTIDYEAEYNKIMQPFQASGHEVHLRNTDEVISLMQKGVDYTKKQQALKPRLREMRALENAGMLGDNLNFAIDLYNGDPKALKHLIETKNIDLSTIDTGPSVDENGNPVQSQYAPTNHIPSEEAYNVKTVLDEVLNSTEGEQIRGIISSFDPDTALKFYQNPGYLKSLQLQIQHGFYKDVADEIEHRKLVGDKSIEGKNWYDTYMTVANDIWKENQKSNYIAQQQELQNLQQQQAQAYYQQQRKSAARPTRGSSPVQQQFDPLSMSDEEFSKLDINQLFR